MRGNEREGGVGYDGIALACCVHRQVSPACRSFDANGDDGVFCNLHRAELRVAGAQERLRVAVFRPFAQDLRVPAQHHPAEPRPILVVAVDDHRDRGVLGNVPQALERNFGTSFRLFVDGDVERALQDREADRHDVGNRAAIGGGEMRDALMPQEPPLRVRRHGLPSAAIAPQRLNARLRGAMSRRPEMRKNVTAITAQRAAMWKDHHQGDPDASTISPKAVRNTPNAAKSSPASAGFSFSCGIGAVKRPSQPAARACAQALRLTSYEQRIISIGPAVPGERFELPTNGLQNRCSTTELTRQINELGSTLDPICYPFATVR